MLSPDMKTEVSDLKSMQVEAFLAWLQQWIETKINEQLQEFEQHIFLRIKETSRAQTIFIGQMYRFMNEAVYSLCQHIQDRNFRSKDGAIEREPTGIPSVIEVANVDTIVSEYISEGELLYKRE